MSPARMPILFLLTLIAPFLKECKLALARMLSSLQYSFHLSLLVPLHLLHSHTLLSWTRWLLCLWVTQLTQWRFWQTRMSLGTHLFIFSHPIIIIQLVWTIPLLSMSGLSSCLLITLTLFLLRVLLSSPGLCLQSLLACIIWLSMSPMIHFMWTRISSRMSKLFHFPLFDIDRKRRRSWRSMELFCCFSIFLWFTLVLCNNLNICDFVNFGL